MTQPPLRNEILRIGEEGNGNLDTKFWLRVFRSFRNISKELRIQQTKFYLWGLCEYYPQNFISRWLGNIALQVALTALTRNSVTAECKSATTRQITDDCLFYFTGTFEATTMSLSKEERIRKISSTNLN